MEAGWRPDPSGRHEHRWWDGVEWAEQVADAGVVRTDPWREPPLTADPSESARRSWPWLAVVGVVAAAVVAGAVVVVRRDRAPGLGEHRSEVVEGRAWLTDLHLDADDVVRIRIEPEGSDVDVQLGVLVDDALADELVTTWLDRYRADLDAVLPGGPGAVTAAAVAEQFFVEPESVFGDFDPLVGPPPGQVYVWADDRGPGEPEANWFVAEAAGTYRVVVVAPVRGGDVRLVVERSPMPYPGLRLYDPQVIDREEFFDEPAFYSGLAPYESTAE